MKPIQVWLPILGPGIDMARSDALCSEPTKSGKGRRLSGMIRR